MEDYTALVEKNFPTASKEAVNEVVEILSYGGPDAIVEAQENCFLSEEAERICQEGVTDHPYPCGWECCGHSHYSFCGVGSPPLRKLKDCF